MRIFLLATGLLLVVSCGYFTMKKNNESLKNLKVGMTKEEVITVMGEPLKDQVYHRPDLWWYYTNPVWSDSVVTRDECTPLVFKEGRLEGWGQEFYKVNYRFKDWRERVIKKETE